MSIIDTASTIVGGTSDRIKGTYDNVADYVDPTRDDRQHAEAVEFGNEHSEIYVNADAEESGQQLNQRAEELEKLDDGGHVVVVDAAQGNVIEQLANHEALQPVYGESGHWTQSEALRLAGTAAGSVNGSLEPELAGSKLGEIGGDGRALNSYLQDKANQLDNKTPEERAHDNIVREGSQGNPVHVVVENQDKMSQEELAATDQFIQGVQEGGAPVSYTADVPPEYAEEMVKNESLDFINEDMFRSEGVPTPSLKQLDAEASMQDLSGDQLRILGMTSPNEETPTSSEDYQAELQAGDATVGANCDQLQRLGLLQETNENQYNVPSQEVQDAAIRQMALSGDPELEDAAERFTDDRDSQEQPEVDPPVGDEPGPEVDPPVGDEPGPEVDPPVEDEPAQESQDNPEQDQQGGPVVDVSGGGSITVEGDLTIVQESPDAQVGNDDILGDYAETQETEVQEQPAETQELAQEQHQTQEQLPSAQAEFHFADNTTGADGTQAEPAAQTEQTEQPNVSADQLTAEADQASQQLPDPATQQPQGQPLPGQALPGQTMGGQTQSV